VPEPPAVEPPGPVPAEPGPPPGWAEHPATARLATTRFEVRWFDAVDSTNRWLLDAARGGAPDGLVAWADVQTAGRGRRGRTWEAAPGSALLVSILFRPDGDATDVAAAGTAVAVAAVEAVRAVAGVEVGAKWPNDLVAVRAPWTDRKVAGVLGEALLRGAEPEAVVVGIGLNVAAAAVPPDLADVATSLDELAGRPVDRVEVLVALLVALERWWRAPRRVLLDAYRGACATLGRVVRVDRTGDVVEGEAVAVLDDGRLRVRTATGDVDVAVGDVVHLRPA
jgi:BirA family transcriptional regulator, biotin operon repressor / biotin---[acetyl-CoA-carboxylase] ligase